MSRWLVVLAVLSTSAALSPAAQAKVRCPLVVDPAGDATGDSVPGGNRADLDILSADFKVRQGVFTSVIRVAKLREGDQLVAGVGYSLFLTRDGVEYNIEALSDLSGQRFHVQTGSATDPTVPYRDTAVTGVVDAGHNEVRMTGPLTAFTTNGTFGGSSVFSAPSVRTFNLYASNAVYAGSSDDDAASANAYRIGQPSCY